MQDLMSSVIKGMNEANGLLETASVSLATRFARNEQAAVEEDEAEAEETSHSTALPATGFTEAEVAEMRQNSSLGLEFDLIRQRQAVAEYKANAEIAEAWQEVTGKTVDREI